MKALRILFAVGMVLCCRVVIVHAVDRTWTGGGGGQYDWSNASNWDSAFNDGDSPIFAGTARDTNNNSYGTVGLIRFDNGNFRISGNPLTLTNGITNTSGWNIIDPTLTVNTVQVFDTGPVGSKLQLNGGVTGTGGIVKTGAGELTLLGSLSYSGPTSIAAGTIKPFANALSANSTMQIDPAGTLYLSTANTVAGLTGTGKLDFYFGSLTVAGQYDFSGAITGYFGKLSIADGAINVLPTSPYPWDQNYIPDSTDIDLAGPTAQLNLNNLSERIGTLSGSGTVNLGTGTLKMGSNSGKSTTFSGNITGTGDVISMSDQVTFTSPLDFTGKFTVGSGMLYFNPDSLGQHDIAFSNGWARLTNDTDFVYTGELSGNTWMQKYGTGKLTIDAPQAIGWGYILSYAGEIALGENGALTSGTNISCNNGSSFDAGGKTIEINGLSVYGGRVHNGDITASEYSIGDATVDVPLHGAGAYLYADSGTSLLNRANDYDGGTYIMYYEGGEGTGSTLVCGVPGALPAGGYLEIGGAGTLDIGSTDQSVGNVYTWSDEWTPGAFCIVGAGTLTGTQFDLTEGIVTASLAGEDAPLNKTGAGWLTLSGTNTYGGATTVSGGKLTIGAGGSIASDATVTAGTLEVLGSASNVTVDGTSGEDAALVGTGNVGDVSLVGSGAQVSPGMQDDGLGTPGFGNVIGQLDIDGSLVWGSGAHYKWHINDAAGSQGTKPGYDFLNIAGSLTFGSFAGDLYLDPITYDGDQAGFMANFLGSQRYDWIVLHASGGIADYADGVIQISGKIPQVDEGGGTLSLSSDGYNLTLTYLPAGGGVFAGPHIVERPVIMAADQQGAGGAFIDLDGKLKHAVDFGDPSSAVVISEDLGCAHPAVSGGRVVYRGADNMYHMWDEVAGDSIITEVMPPADYAGGISIWRDPSVDMSKIVMEGNDGIYAFVSGQGFNRIADGNQYRHPSVAGDKVVLEYYGDNGTKSLLKMFNLATGDWDHSDIGWADIEVEINYGDNLEGACPWLAYDGAGGYYVAWQGWNDTNDVWNLFYWSSAEPETILNLTELIGADDGAGKYYSDMYPVLDTTGSLVAFQRLDDWDIYEYSLDTGILTPVSATSGVDEMYPTIGGGGQVAWGNYDPSSGAFQGMGFEQDGGGEVPEPSTLLLLLPLIGFGLRRKLRTAKK